MPLFFYAQECREEDTSKLPVPRARAGVINFFCSIVNIRPLAAEKGWKAIFYKEERDYGRIDVFDG